MTISITYALSHFPTQSKSAFNCQWPYLLLMLSITYPHTQLVRRIHLPNDHIAYLHSQSLPPHIHSIRHTRSLTKYSSTHQFVKNSNHLHTKANHPLVPTQSLYLWPVILFGYSLPNLFNHNATQSPSHVACPATQLQNHTTLKPTAILQMYSKW